MIKEWLYKVYAKRHACVHSHTPAWNTTYHIALLCETEETPIVQALRAEGKQVDVFTMPDKKEVCFWTNRPKKQVLQAAGKEHYDLMMDVCTSPSLTMRYIAVSIRADFTAGCSLTQGSYDLTIQVDKVITPMYVYEQIVKYMHMFFDNKQ